MRRIALLILGGLAVLGPIAGASGQAQAPNRTPNPGTAPAPAAPRTASQAPAAPAGPPQGRAATYDPAVQRASAPAQAAPAPGAGAAVQSRPASPAPSPGQAPAPLASPPTAPAEAAPAANQAELDAILARWEQISGKIETLYAAFEQVDELSVVGETKVYKGSAYLQRPNLVVLDLHEKQAKADGGEAFVFDRRILVNGAEVVEFDGSAQQINIYPMPKDAQQRALEEGPLPFLFRMNVAEFKGRYEAFLMAPQQEGTHRIGVRPRHPVDREAFSVAVLILDAKTLQVRSIHTLSPNGKDRQNYVIKALQANLEIKPEYFAWGPPQAQEFQQKGWRVVRNPEPQAEPTPPAAPEIGSQPDLAPIPR